MTDIEMMDWVFHKLYNDGDYKEYDFDNLLLESGILSHQRDIDILRTNILKTGLAKTNIEWEDTGDYRTQILTITLTDAGIGVFKKYKKYSDYFPIAKETKKDLKVVSAELDISKKQAEIDLLKAQIKDYPNLVRRANISTSAAVISAIIALLSALAVIFLKK